MSTVSAPLKYLFIAEFEGGEVYFQNSDDVAVVKESGSSFSDVVGRLDELKSFTLKQHLEGDAEIVRVDLKTGLFTVNGVEISIAPQLFVPINPFKLIYLREVHETMNQDGSNHQRFVNRYIVGWETIDHKGHSLQRTVIIA